MASCECVEVSELSTETSANGRPPSPYHHHLSHLNEDASHDRSAEFNWLFRERRRFNPSRCLRENPPGSRPKAVGGAIWSVIVCRSPTYTPPKQSARRLDKARQAPDPSSPRVGRRMFSWLVCTCVATHVAPEAQHFKPRLTQTRVLQAVHMF